MKTAAFALLAAAGCGLIHCNHAQAAYIGLSLEDASAIFLNHPNPNVPRSFPPDTSIFRLYANFNSNTAADRVNAVAGTPDSPFVVNVQYGMFYNYTEDLNGDIMHFHLPGLAPIDRVWDTWVTIGNAINGGSMALTPDFADQTNNLGYLSSSIFATNVAWFVSPNDAQGFAVATAVGQAPAPPGTFRVLLAQFTIAHFAPITIQGSLLLNVNGVNLLNQTFYVPTPAAPVLFACAAMFTSRRQRREP